MPAAKAATLEALEAFRATSQLKSHGGGVPLSEVEQWCATTAKKLAEVGESLTAKLQLCHSKVQARDETIRRLRQRLDLKAGGGRFKLAAPGQPSVPVEDLETPWPLEVASPLSTAARTSSMSHMEKSSPSAARVGQKRVDPSWKVVPRRATMEGHAGPSASERAQHAQLRREVAQLRRAHMELVSQLRARDVQVEQLTAMIRDLVAQRQLGLQRQMQESLHAPEHEKRSPQLGSAAPGSASLDSRDRAPRFRSSMSALVSAQERRAQEIAASSLRTAEAERSRMIAAAAAVAATGVPASGALSAVPPKTRDRDRDRSAGALPHTPRRKLRDAIGHPTRVAVETPASRRRTTSGTRAVIRSASARERAARRLRDGVGSSWQRH